MAAKERERIPREPASGPVEIPRDLEADRAAYLAQVSTLVESGALPEGALLQLDRYALLLYDRIATLSLVAKRDRPTLFTRHLLDSLNPISLFPSPPGAALDIGSGGGLPGIPLAIVWPASRVVLVESRERKAAFLERATRVLGLKNVRVVCERLVEHSRKGEPVYDALFVRAVADMPRLIDDMAPRCLPGATWTYFAGGGIDRVKLAADLAVTGRRGDEVTGRFGGRLLHGLV
jgi:16S rRNA (guanine527-N7)-methyltransferase